MRNAHCLVHCAYMPITGKQMRIKKIIIDSILPTLKIDNSKKIYFVHV